MPEHNVGDPIRATILVNPDNHLRARIARKHVPGYMQHNEFKVINDFKFALCDGDEVEGCLINTRPNGVSWHIHYVFYIQQNVTRDVEYEFFVPVINMAIVDRINQMKHLYGLPKPIIKVDDIFKRRRFPVYVLARYLGMYFMYRFFRHQLKDHEITEMYNLKRISLYSALERIHEERDPQVNEAINDLKEELAKMINNIK